jgi:hypothetical protein
MSFLLVSRSAAPYFRAFRPYGHLEQRVFTTLLQELASPEVAIPMESAAAVARLNNDLIFI